MRPRRPTFLSADCCVSEIALSTIKIQLSVLVEYKPDLIIISLNMNCSRQDISENCYVGIKQQSFITQSVDAIYE